MGRFLLIVGLLVILAGCGLSALSFSSAMTGSIQSIVESSTTGPQESELCRTGERLVEEAGASEYTPGQGYGRSVRYFCVDDAGTRREVTAEFAKDLVSSIFGAFGGVGSLFGGQFLGAAVSGVGVLLVLIGALSMRRRRAQTVTIGGSGQADGTTVVRVGGREVRVPSEGSRYVQPASPLSSSSSGTSAGLTARLEQLEDARKAGLISQAEYERLRQQILDSLKP